MNMGFATSKIGGKVSFMLVMALLLSIMAPAHMAYATTTAPVSISSFTNAAGDLHINAGKGEGVKSGAKGIILRDEKKIADYEVVSVNWGFSRIEVSNLESGYTIQPGDSAPIMTEEEAPKKKSAFSSRTLWTVLGVVAAALLIKGSSKSGDEGSGTSTIAFAEPEKTIGNDGSVIVTLTVVVRDSSGFTAPDGTVVTFMTTAGRLDRSQVSTSGGRATVRLTKDSSDDAEVATVTAKCDGKTATRTVSFISTVEIEAEPTTIMVKDAGSSENTTTTITVTCRDVNGNPATSGEVEFVASQGDIVDKADIGANGVVTASFSSGQAGKASVTAMWAKANASVMITVTAGPPNSVTVNSSTGTLICDGNSSATITATVKDMKGNNVVDGTIVKFSVTPDGAGGGNGTITAQATTTNGNATATLTTRDSAGDPSKSGMATVKAEVLMAGQPSTVPAPLIDISNTTMVQFVGVAVGEIRLGAEPANIRGWDIVGNTTTLKAAVFNTDRQPVPDGTAVYFSSTHGIISGGMATTSGGIASIPLVSDASGASSWDGHVDVTAMSGTFSFTQPGLVIFSGPPSPGRCTADISQSSLSAVGGQATISVTALDLNGNPVADGTKVTAITDKGTIANSSSTTTGGSVAFTLTTSTNPESPTQQGDGTVRISIDSGGTNAETGGQAVTLTLPFTVIP